MKDQPEEKAKQPGLEHQGQETRWRPPGLDHAEGHRANRSQQPRLDHPREIKAAKRWPPGLEHPGGYGPKPRTATSEEEGEQPRTGSSGAEQEGGAENRDQLISSGRKNTTPSFGGSTAVRQEEGANHHKIILGRPGTISRARAAGPEPQQQVRRGMMAKTRTRHKPRTGTSGKEVEQPETGVRGSRRRSQTTQGQYSGATRDKIKGKGRRARTTTSRGEGDEDQANRLGGGKNGPDKDSQAGHEGEAAPKEGSAGGESQTPWTGTSGPGPRSKKADHPEGRGAAKKSRQPGPDHLGKTKVAADRSPGLDQ